MAILKHISVKNRFYSDAVEYLTCQFDEYTNKPILDGKGRIMERENYLIDGVNCDVDSFGAECIETNRFYGKNNSVNDVKAHHYIISFEPEDDITMEQAMEFGKKWLAEFAPGHQAVVAVHPDGHNNSRNMHIHMVINSVRKFPGRKSIWHDKPCEWKQCCKHKSTGKMMYHAKKWVMDKCIRLGLGQADLLARKHKDNYWVEKRLMDKNASDGVGVTSDRELIRNTIDKILPTVNSFEQLIEYLRAIYHWTIRVTNKTVTFAMPDMKKGIRGNKLGEGYGKAELADRIRGFVAEREAKDLAMKQMEAEIEALIQSEQEKKRKQAEELKKREGISAIRNRVAERNSRRFNLYLDEMDRKEWNNAYLDYLEGQEIVDWKTATAEMISTPIMTRVEFEAMQEKQAKREEAVSSYTETPVIDEVVAENEESVVEINDISVEEVVADFYETDAVSQESKAEEQIVDVVVKAEKSEQIDEKLNIENTDTIDGMAYEQDTSSLILLLADGMDWSDMNRHLFLLQEKLNTYIWYIDSGQYEEKYPNVKRIEMRVSFLFEEPKLCHRLLEKAKHVFMNVFENVEMIVENGEIKEGEIYGQGSF